MVGSPDLVGKIFEVEKRVKREGFLSLAASLAIVNREVEAKLGVGEGGHVDRDLLLARTAKNGPTGILFVEHSADPGEQIVARHRLAFRNPGQDEIQEGLRVVEILLEFDCVNKKSF